MKKYLQLISFLFCFYGGIKGISQPYESLFGAQSTSWNVDAAADVVYGYHQTDSLIVGEDTIIQNNIYRKIFRFPDFQAQELYGFLREDTTQGKAWFRFHPYANSTNDTIEALIMDLSLALGDTFRWDSLDFGIVDSVYYMNEKKHVRLNRKNHFILNWEYITFIEGVGTNSGIDIFNSDQIKQFQYLLCAYKDGQRTYTNASNYSCHRYNASIQEKTSNSIRIYPTIVSQDLWVELEQPAFVNIQLLDVTGKTILKQQKHMEKEVLNLRHIPSGIYFISIDVNDTHFYEKIIKR